MLDTIFGLNIRLGRLKFLLSCIAVGILNIILFIPVILYVFQTAKTHGAVPSSSWPFVALQAFYVLASFMLASMRIRDIGWDPIIVISAWVAVLVIDWLIATKVPALAFAKHHVTVVGSLINFGVVLVLLFWPSGNYAGESRYAHSALRRQPN